MTDIERSSATGPLRGSLAQAVLQRALVVLWVGVLPALLALLVLRFLVPLGGAGLAGALALVVHALPLPCAVALYFVFSAVLRYWRFHVPGGRYASALPAHLVPGERAPERLAEWAAHATRLTVLTTAPMKRRLGAMLSPDARADVDAQIADLRAGLETGDLQRARSAAASLASTARAPLAARRRRELFTAVAVAAGAALVAVAVRQVIVKPYQVVSASMLPTLEPDDVLLGSRLAYSLGKKPAPHRGDIIAFRSASVALPPMVGVRPPDVLVKRVIGLPGDRITMHGGQPVINEWPVPFCDAGEYVFLQPLAAGGSVHGRLRVEFVDDRAYLTVHAMSAAFDATYEVKPGEVFVLGDNRGNSLDSRAWNRGHGGGVPLDGIDALARWFVAGRHRNGDVDLSRLGRSVDGLQARLRVEGMDGRSLDDGIARCLKDRPADTRPPSPYEPAGMRASAEPSR